MEKQNLTLSLPKGLFRKAKIMAASRHKSLSEFLRESLEEKIRESSGYRFRIGFHNSAGHAP